MEGLELLKKFSGVRAPEGFERTVLDRLPSERTRRSRRQFFLRYAYAGSAAVFLVGAVMAALLLFNGDGGRTPAGNQIGKFPGPGPVFSDRAGTPEALPFIPVLETVNYSAEVRSASYEPQTIYILEQVSEGAPSGIKY